VKWNGRIKSLEHWGKMIESKHWRPIFSKVTATNPWFTLDNLELAFQGLQRYLDPVKLTRWLEDYPNHTSSRKTIGLIMAGNIPLVGIHDFICCYLCGHHVVIKPSSQDNLLMTALIDLLRVADASAECHLTVTNDLSHINIDAIIATGSDNTNRYFKYQFGDIPGIIRHNRSSVGIIRGDETRQQLQALGLDVLSYFGRGCRNISKLLVPEQYDFGEFISNNQTYQSLLDNPKYFNNYSHQKALNLVQQTNHIDGEYLVLMENESLVSPLATLYFQYYTDPSHLRDIIGRQQRKIQCIASAGGWYPQSFDFGSLQSPELWDYADGVDTLAFLLSL
jgi:hypothetical protein